MYVIDASVYVALVRADEPDHQRSWEWFLQSQHDQASVSAPAILAAEVAAAISRGVGSPELAHQVVAQLLQADLVGLFPVTIALAERAAAIAADHRIRGCDAVYIALAEHQGTTLVTLDRQQLERGVPVVAVREP